MRLKHRVDKNHSDVIAALRAAGASVTDTSAVGHGFADVVAGFRGKTYLIEIKSERGTLTPDELAWFSEWRGQVSVVYGVDDALRAVGAV